MDASIDRCLKIISIAVTCLFLCTGLLADTAGDFELAIFIKNEPKPLDQVVLRELCSGLTQNLQKQSSPQTKLGIFSIKKCSSESVPLPVNYTLLVSISNDTTLIELIRKSKSKKNVVLYKRNIENFTKDTAAAYRQKVLELLSLDIMFSLPIQALAALRDDRPISNLILDRNGLLQKVLQSLKKEVYLQQTYWSSVQKRWQVAHAVEAEIRLSLVDGDQLQFSFVAKRAVRVLDRKQSYFLSLGENLPVIREKISQKLKSLLDQKLSHLRLPGEEPAVNRPKIARPLFINCNIQLGLGLPLAAEAELLNDSRLLVGRGQCPIPANLQIEFSFDHWLTSKNMTEDRDSHLTLTKYRFGIGYPVSLGLLEGLSFMPSLFLMRWNMDASLQNSLQPSRPNRSLSFTNSFFAGITLAASYETKSFKVVTSILTNLSNDIDRRKKERVVDQSFYASLEYPRLKVFADNFISTFVFFQSDSVDVVAPYIEVGNPIPGQERKINLGQNWLGLGLKYE